MTRFDTLFIIGGGLAALAACSPAEPKHDVAYYRSHSDARAAMMAVCRASHCSWSSALRRR